MISWGQNAPFASKNPCISKLKYKTSYQAERSGQADIADNLIHIALSAYIRIYNSGSWVTIYYYVNTYLSHLDLHVFITIYLFNAHRLITIIPELTLCTHFILNCSNLYSLCQTIVTTTVQCYSIMARPLQLPHPNQSCDHVISILKWALYYVHHDQ